MRAAKLYSSSVIILSLAALVENLAYALPMTYFPNYVQLLAHQLLTLAFSPPLSPQPMLLSPKNSEVYQTESAEKK